MLAHHNRNHPTTHLLAGIFPTPQTPYAHIVHSLKEESMPLSSLETPKSLLGDRVYHPTMVKSNYAAVTEMPYGVIPDITLTTPSDLDFEPALAP